MKRGGPLKRSAIKRGRKPIKQRSERRLSFEDELRGMRLIVEARAQHRCELCRIRPLEVVHHKLRRSQGGTNELNNLLGLCDADHKEIHANPSWAYDHGYLLRRHALQ